ncbi:ATP-dependent helicase [Streptomyces sp. A2-16]|uniref:UvrD-helicase domain-containing protein n=1 Tax=Streptomyces sp. A2-16 TaxID=2781734 RepID=UPI001BAF76CB|nr:ATP-dependent helicase [Streptomyces sp. A2-16]
MRSRVSAPDTPADIQLRGLLDGDQLRSFVMVAGAGSGKTTSLVKALDHVVTQHGARLRARTQQVACITYTEVAAKEIHSDVGNSPLVSVSTIHSFLWTLIKPFQRDIGRWVDHHIRSAIQEIQEKQENYTSRTRSTTIAKDASDLEKLNLQLQLVKEVERYSYGVGSDYAKGILGHEDIVTMVPDLILDSKLLVRIVASKHPYIFVDESQDTFPKVVEALKYIDAQVQGAICLGFFGDPMQQIFQRGVGEIVAEAEWERIEKPENFRSSSRVLNVINQVRSDADGMVQVPGRLPEKQVAGEFFFFVLPADDQRSERLERVRAWLGQNSEAGSWAADSADDGEGAKILMIVHRMVAKRMGFEQLYAAFHDGGSKGLKEAFDEGDAWPLRPFEDVILPICAADSVDSPSVIAVLRQSGGVFNLDASDQDLRKRLTLARDAVSLLRTNVTEGGSGSVGKALRLAVAAGLFAPDPRLSAYLEPDGMHAEIVLGSETKEVLDAFLACDVGEISAYFRYIQQQSPYATQHGTKGTEFSKVIVVLDDEEGKYSLYSYEKLFGIKELSDTDKRNLAAGKDSVLERTRRLLYVCVSRAVESLAVVVFAGNTAEAKLAIEKSKIVAGGKILTDADLAPEAS